MLGMGKNTVEIIIAAKDRTQAAFAKVNTQMKTMGGTSGKLNSAMGSLKGGLSNVTSSLGSFGAALGPVGIAVAAAAVVIATLGGAAFKASLEFEKAFATIRVGTGATGDALKGFEEDFRTIFGDIPANAAAISKALTAMATTTDASGTVLQDLTTNIMDVNRMLGEDGPANAQAFAEAMKQWQIPAASGVGLMDQFFKITQATGIGFGELTGAMNAYGPVLQNAGFTAAESAELFGRLEGSGIAVSRVMPGLNAAFRKWAEEGKNGKDSLEATIAAVRDAETSMEALTIATDTFGAEGAQRMTTAVRNGTFELSSLGEMLKGTEGLIMETSDATLTFGDKLTLLKNNVTGAIAPIGDAITNVLGNAMDGLGKAFDSLQKIAGPALKMIYLQFKLLAIPFGVMFVQFKALQAFFEGFAGPIIAALAPLRESFEALQQKFKEGSEKLTILSDIFTIVTAGAKILGEWVGVLVSKALTPLIAKLQDGIQMLTNFYDKLGPVKDLIEGIKGVAGGVVEGISNIADSLKETVPPIEDVKEALKELEKEGPKAPQAVAVAWALAIKAFHEGTGTYKEAIEGIKEKITALTEEWMTATDKRKTAIEKEVNVLQSEEEALEDLKKTAEDTLSSTAKETEEATQKMEEFTVAIGDTTISFKGAAVEVVKNADAYKKLQDSAQKLIDLDWSVFTEFEAALPNIDAGIGDMASSFVGLKDVLEDNIEELENIQQSVMDISEISAPFLEAGFLNGIKAICSFAGSLKDAGSAIGDFSSLQEVSIEGCINFSTHVHDMVSALEILERQMEDLVPAFGDMDLLITDIADAFVYSSGKGEEIERKTSRAFDKIDSHAKKYNVTLADLLEMHIRSGQSSEFMSDRFKDMGLTIADGYDIFKEWQTEIYNSTGLVLNLAETMDLALLSEKERIEWFEKEMRTERAITKHLNEQTEALKAQTDQLSKITDVLQPYLEFMRTLNELAALSTLSTAELNSGLNSINDTLINLSTSLSTFDLRPVMELLFGTKIAEGDDIGKFTGGIAKGFTDVMADYQVVFGALIDYISRLSFAITSLVSSFDALENISESVLADETKLKDLFGEITGIMLNFSKAMGEAGFANTLATAMEVMLKSAAPLIAYFQENNAAVDLFNSTLTTFTTTIKNVIDTMDLLKRMSEMTVPSVDELGAGFDRAKEFVGAFDKALMEHIGLTRGEEYNTYNLEKLFDNVFTSIMRFADDWARIEKEMGDSFEIFDDGVATITSLIGGIESLVAAFVALKDIAIPSSTDMEAIFTKIRDGIAAVTEALDSPVWTEITTNLGRFKTKWDEISEGVGVSLKSFSDVITIFADIVDATKRLIDTFTDMEDIVVITADQIETAFKDIPAIVDEVTKYLATNSFASLRSELRELNTEWQKYAVEMEKSMEAFNTVIDTFSTLISKVLSLSQSLSELRDMSVLSVRDIDEALKNIPVFLDGFVDALALNMSAIKESLKDLDTEWLKHADAMKDTMPSYEASTEQIGKLIGSLLSLNSALEQLAEMGTISGRAFDRGFSSLIKSISNFAGSLSKNVSGVIDSLWQLARVWQANKAILAPLMDTFMVVTYAFWEIANNANAMADAFRDLQKNSGSLEKGFKSLIVFINQVVKSTKKFYTAEVAAELATFITDVGKVIDAFVTLERDLNDAMRKVEDAIDGAVNNMHKEISTLGDLPASAYTHGLNTLQEFVNGLIDKEPALKEEMHIISGIIHDFLGVESPTKLGPLRDIDEWPRNLIQSYSSGLEAEMHTLNASFAGFSPSMMAGSTGGGNRSIVIHNTQYVNSREDADFAARGIERILQKHEVM